MILAQIDAVQTGFEQLGALEGQEGRAAQLRNLQRELERRHFSLQASSVPFRILRKNNVDGSDSRPEDLSELEHSASVILKRANTPDEQITQDRAFTALLGHIETVSSQLKTLSQQTWEAHCSDPPGLDDAFCDLLQNVPGHAQRVTSLRELSRRLGELARIPPDKEALFREYETARKRIQTLIGQINATQFPQSVLAFFKATGTGGAPYSMLTDEVREWLKDNGMLDRLRILLR
jgi:hypothetical protein